MAESFRREAEDHDRSRAPLVQDNLACIRDHGLLSVDIQNIQTASVKDLMDLGKLGLMLDVAGAAGKLCKGGFGDIVLCRSESSGSDDYLIVGQFFGKGGNNLVMVVSDRDHAIYLDSEISELA